MSYPYLPKKKKALRDLWREYWLEAVIYTAAALIVLAFCGWVQWLRVTAFNDATGSNVDYWESFFINLRVVAPAK